MTTIDYNLRCSQCAGDLRGAELHGACPHCWADVADTVAVALIDSATHTVADDVSCIECGYNVRTLGLAAKCPECGASVLESVRPGDLRFADVRWLKIVQSGVSDLLLATGAFVLSILLLTVYDIPSLEIVASVLGLLGIGIGIAGLVCGVGGVVCTTAHEPYSRTPRFVRAMGKIVRSCCLSFAVCLAGLSLIHLGITSQGAIYVFGLAFLFAAWIGPMCLFLCLRHVAFRGRDSLLCKLSTVLSRMIAALGIFSVIGAVWRVVFMTFILSPLVPAVPSDVWLDLLGGCYWLAFWVLTISVLILGVVLLFKYRTLLSEAIVQAESLTEPHPSGGADSSERGNTD